jgi:hypothetical protein
MTFYLLATTPVARHVGVWKLATGNWQLVTGNRYRYLTAAANRQSSIVNRQ